jgi:hypothetical protein
MGDSPLLGSGQKNSSKLSEDSPDPVLCRAAKSLSLAT